MTSSRRGALSLALALLTTACVPVAMISPSSEPSKKPAASQTAAASGFTGTVLGLDGKPAANVAVRAFLIGEAGTNLIGQAGTNVIAAGGGNVIASGGLNYRVLAAPSEVKTDESGRFTLEVAGEGKFNLEAVLKDDVKAMLQNLAPKSSAISLKLAKTGTISGKVTAPQAPSVTDFEGVDVFIPGTGYTAKTDKNGRFTIANVPVGSFTLVASKATLGRAQATGVEVSSEQTTNVAAMALSVAAPTIKSVSPAIAGPGAELTISGERFGATTGKALQVTVAGVAVPDAERVDDATIKLKLPANAVNGDVVVTVDGVPSGPSSIRVLKSLTIDGLPSQLLKGKTYVVSIAGTDTADRQISSPPVSWSTDGGLVYEEAKSEAMAQAIGQASITATNGTLKATISAEVLPFLYEVTTVAGNGTLRRKDGKGKEAQFSPIVSLTRDSEGNLYALEAAGNAIRKITPDGTVTTLYAGTDINLFMTQLPQLAVGADDTLYLVDPEQNQVLKLNASGQLVPFAGSGSRGNVDAPFPLNATFNTPSLLCPDSAGGYWVGSATTMDGPPALLRRLTPSGVTTPTFGWSGAIPQPKGYTAMTADSFGFLYVAENTVPSLGAEPICRVLKLAPDAAPQMIAGSSTSGHQDGQGAAASFARISAMAPFGTGTLLVGDTTILTASAGNVLTYGLLRTIDPEGRVSTLLGGKTTDELRFRDGYGTEVRFASIDGIVPMADGSIYVADGYNGRIRKISIVKAQ